MSHTLLPQIPELYSLLNYKDIIISHVPCDAPAVTKVIVVTLNRPQRHNAVNGNILEALISVFNVIDNDDRVRAVVLTGAGKSFCAGMDLSEGPEGLMKIKQNPDAMNQWKDTGGRAALAISRCSKPTIVAVNGGAAGFGATSILSAVIRVAWKDAKINLPFARRGLTMESVSAFYLPKLVGLSNANHIVTTGNTYTASDPIVSGLFSKLLPTPEETVRCAIELATGIAENTSITSTKLMRDMMLYCPDTPEGTHDLDFEVFITSFGSKDNIEGLTSFMEKRKAEFSGGFNRSASPFHPSWESMTLKAKI
ncbi:ClpP/crotonase-like domain-containing protein [Colletotrichum godetiae]|uniref:ClpP/crotonase-like domain-containing protein n=1 Tax=Colletotrichum godetiae TaxID=1209918 RepID=A0AAJ0AKR0_9PEZI|nr:ClpP/crotonase-like domain-containing protein [Colletotrichum godetiae]KAK1673516.1 ClpP/crotonase-like domain-containing protein [Colletotrichum godetiae]